MSEPANDILRHSQQITNDFLPTLNNPLESENEEDEEESTEETPASDKNSNTFLYAVLGGALTALSAFAIYKARTS